MVSKLQKLLVGHGLGINAAETLRAANAYAKILDAIAEAREAAAGALEAGIAAHAKVTTTTQCTPLC